jgi:hypothetical protein
LALTSPTSGGRSVGIVRLGTKATELSLVLGLDEYDFTGIKSDILSKYMTNEIIHFDIEVNKRKF